MPTGSLQGARTRHSSTVLPNDLVLFLCQQCVAAWRAAAVQTVRHLDRRQQGGLLRVVGEQVAACEPEPRFPLQSTMVPPLRLTTVPVIALAWSDATKAATLASSASVVIRLRCVMLSCRV